MQLFTRFLLLAIPGMLISSWTSLAATFEPVPFCVVQDYEEGLCDSPVFNKPTNCLITNDYCIGSYRIQSCEACRTGFVASSENLETAKCANISYTTCVLASLEGGDDAAGCQDADDCPPKIKIIEHGSAVVPGVCNTTNNTCTNLCSARNSEIICDEGYRPHSMFCECVADDGGEEEVECITDNDCVETQAIEHGSALVSGVCLVDNTCSFLCTAQNAEITCDEGYHQSGTLCECVADEEPECTTNDDCVETQIIEHGSALVSGVCLVDNTCSFLCTAKNSEITCDKGYHPSATLCECIEDEKPECITDNDCTNTEEAVIGGVKKTTGTCVSGSCSYKSLVICNSGYYNSLSVCQPCTNSNDALVSGVGVASPSGATSIEQCYIASGSKFRDYAGNEYEIVDNNCSY